MSTYNMEKQHKLGKLHALERICMLLDEDSFREIGSNITNLEDAFNIKKGQFPYDGVITGYGTIGGQKVVIYSEDFTVIGGTLGKQHGFKIANAIKMAIESRCPVIGINDSGGARIQEGVNALAGYGEIFYYNTMASGYIPQISIIAGNCAGGAVYSPGITDFIFVIDEISQMFVTGPKVIKSVTNEDITAKELGGANVHASKSGVAHFHMPNEKECFRRVKELISIIPPCYEDGYLHTNRPALPKYNENVTFNEDLANIIPKESNHSYDIHDVINGIVDTDSFIEVQEEFARNVVVGFGRIKGVVIGIIADQPKFMAGVLDCDSSDKAARFIRYHIALYTGDLHQSCHRITHQSQQIFHGHSRCSRDLCAVTALEIYQCSGCHGTGRSDLRLASARRSADGRTGGYDLPDSRRHIHGFQDFIGILAPLLKIRYQHRRQYSAGSRRRCRYNTFHAGIGFSHLQSSRNAGVHIFPTQ